MEKNKILEIVPSLKDGGVERLVFNYALYLDKNAFSIKILTIFSTKRINSSIIKEAKTKNIKISNCLSIIECWDDHFLNRLFKKMLSKKIISKKIKYFIKKHNIKIIHAHLDVLQYIAPISDFLFKEKIDYCIHVIRFQKDGLENNTIKKIGPLKYY